MLRICISMLNFPVRKYQIIVVDPPWPISKLTRLARPNQVEMDYRVMSLADIRDLPIGTLADTRCLCFLWTIQKYLFESRAILEHWGFHHLLTMVWEKTYGRSTGMPLYGFRWNAEFILVGYITKPDLWPKRPLIPAVFQANNMAHSVKPDRFYKMIEPLGYPRIDLFARRSRDGWDVWGDEVTGIENVQ